MQQETIFTKQINKNKLLTFPLSSPNYFHFQTCFTPPKDLYFTMHFNDNRPLAKISKTTGKPRFSSLFYFQTKLRQPRQKTQGKRPLPLGSIFEKHLKELVAGKDRKRTHFSENSTMHLGKNKKISVLKIKTLFINPISTQPQKGSGKAFKKPFEPG
ncbi:hypothetical protein [Dethiosulfatarculus sandiegensis]|nr:hypothetical protein [Dethiosulfatarculus sandiegensis]